MTVSPNNGFMTSPPHLRRILVSVLAVSVPSGLLGCMARNSEFGCPLAGGFRLVRTAAGQVEIEPPSWSKAAAGLPAEVVEIACDEKMIFAKRENVPHEADFSGDKKI